jgi:hypothetical protein
MKTNAVVYFLNSWRNGLEGQYRHVVGLYHHYLPSRANRCMEDVSALERILVYRIALLHIEFIAPLYNNILVHKKSSVYITM